MRKRHAAVFVSHPPAPATSDFSPCRFTSTSDYLFAISTKLLLKVDYVNSYTGYFSLKDFDNNFESCKLFQNVFNNNCSSNSIFLCCIPIELPDAPLWNSFINAIDMWNVCLQYGIDLWMEMHKLLSDNTNSVLLGFYHFNCNNRTMLLQNCLLRMLLLWH